MSLPCAVAKGQIPESTTIALGLDEITCRPSIFEEMNVHPFDYVVAETERQSGTMREAVGMFYALQMFSNVWNRGYRINKTHILAAAESINGVTEHRQVPAVFNQGIPAVPPGAQLERAMERWYETINSSRAEVTSYSDNLFDTAREIADYLTREFLLIHPFTDGNGRVGSLIWNFLNGSIQSPEIMPYFFGDK